MNLEETVTKLGKMLEKKNKAYGSAFEKTADMLLILFPHGIAPHQYEAATVLIRILDKIMRITNGAFDDSWRDIAGYAILMETKYQKNAKQMMKDILDGKTPRGTRTRKTNNKGARKEPMDG